MPEQMQLELQDIVRPMLTESLSACIEQLTNVDTGTYDQLAAERAIFRCMAEEIDDCYRRYYGEAIQLICRELRSANIPLLAVERKNPELNWQTAAALYRAYDVDIAVKLSEILCEGLTFTDDGAHFLCSIPCDDVIFSAGTREQLLSGKFTLAYLYTVYNDDGVPAEYETPPLEKKYLDTLTHPLPGCMIKNGWYDPRSDRTRLHMGTDILAERNTEILSVTDGTVLYIGFSRIPGYYVIVRDASGYEYHYYHMVRRSDLVSEGEAVSQGQPIGLVGNTGNSVANHLHLAITTPEGRYINPYDVFMQANIGPIRMKG